MGAMTPRQKQGIMAICQDCDGNFYYNDKLDGIWGKKSQEAAERFLKDFTGEEATPAPEPADDFWGEIEYFDREEFRCKCGGKYCNGFPVEPDEKLVRFLDGLRDHFGVPVTITSGVRCKQHNANVNGTSRSQHMLGNAADIKVRGIDPVDVYEYADEEFGKSGGVGLYKSFTHVDVRSTKSRWDG